jgi:hypothetical protein
MSYIEGLVLIGYLIIDGFSFSIKKCPYYRFTRVKKLNLAISRLESIRLVDLLGEIPCIGGCISLSIKCICVLLLGMGEAIIERRFPPLRENKS